MTLKAFLLRFGGLVLFTIVGWALFLTTINLLIISGTMPSGDGSDGFGQILMRQTAYVYLGSIAMGIAGVFIKEQWGRVLHFAPLYASSVFAVIYTLIHH